MVARRVVSSVPLLGYWGSFANWRPAMDGVVPAPSDQRSLPGGLETGYDVIPIVRGLARFVAEAMHSSALLMARTLAFPVPLAYEWQLFAAKWHDVYRAAEWIYCADVSLRVWPGWPGWPVGDSDMELELVAAGLAAADIAGRRESFSFPLEEGPGVR